MINCINRITEYKIRFLEFLSPLIPLGIRLWTASIFWKSGTLKLPAGFLGIGQGNWDTTIILFTYEHPLPYVSPEFAAYTGTFFEILCPILLVLGLGTRFAAFVLIAMSLTMEFIYQHNIEHIYWSVLMAVILFKGADKISLDYLIRKKNLGI